MIRIAESTTIPGGQVMIPVLISLDDKPMLAKAASSFDSLESDNMAIPCTASINFAATPMHGGIQLVHMSISREAMLFGIIRPEEKAGICQKARCDSWQSEQSDSLQGFLASSPAALNTVIEKETEHHRSQFTIVGSDFLVKES
jgi:hypothetical protein